MIVDVISERSRLIDQGGIASIDVTSKLRSSLCFPAQLKLYRVARKLWGGGTDRFHVLYTFTIESTQWSFNQSGSMR